MVNTHMKKGPVEELPIRDTISIDKQNSLDSRVREDNRMREKSFDKVPTTGVTQTSRFEPERSQNAAADPIANILISKL